MSDGEAPPLPNALVDHHLAEEARRASRGQFGGRGVPLSPHHAWDFGRLQLQVHVLLERPDAGVHLNAQLVGRHRCLTRAVTRALLFKILFPFFGSNSVTSAGRARLILRPFQTRVHATFAPK